MILTVDAGNSNITLGGFEGDSLRFVSRISTNPACTGDELAVKLLGALALNKVNARDIDGVMAASVVPQLNAAVKEAVHTAFSKRPLFVGPGIKSGIGIRCEVPSSVGADIIAAAAAAYFLYGGPCLIVDAGTATKMTVVNGEGAFIGTSIIPGVLMGLSALSDGTAQLPKISLEVPPSVIGKNTVDCMRSGVLFGNAALIDGMIDRINEEYGEPLKVCATGGMASVLVPLCRRQMLLDEHLVLKGLNILYHKNKA